MIAIALYFAHSMSAELRATDNRVAGLEAEQAIEGARRYLSCMLSNVNQAGVMPDPTVYLHEAVPVGNAHFWLIGRGDEQSNAPTSLHFGLIDESSKINLNMSNTTVLSNMLMNLPLPKLTPDIVANILAWASTNTTTSANSGAQSDTYERMQPPYSCKNSPYETVDELRLVYNIDMDLLYGEDANLNGALDPNENDGETLPPSDNMDGLLNPGLLEYVTVYSKEPSTYIVTNATGVTTNIARVNITGTPVQATIVNVLTTNGIASARATQIFANLRGATITSPLQFFYLGQLTTAEISQVESSISGSNVVGLINVNTASSTVLSCVPGLTNGQAAQLISLPPWPIPITLNGSIGTGHPSAQPAGRHHRRALSHRAAVISTRRILPRWATMAVVTAVTNSFLTPPKACPPSCIARTSAILAGRWARTFATNGCWQKRHHD